MPQKKAGGVPIMTQNAHVNIILAVYNGEKHLKKQLDSLLAQTYDNITIYIRDDGSSDHSVAFIQQYIQKNTSKKEIILLEQDGQNLKCPGSFYEIIRRCAPADYYSLCDQDDYWYPQKIEWAVNMLERQNCPDSTPLLYCSSCDYISEDGDIIRHFPPQPDNLPLEHVIYHAPASGFTILFNEALRQKMVIQTTPSRELHDGWLIRGAVCFGRTVYDPRSTAAHIRHEDAVTAGDSDNRHLLLYFLRNELFGEAVSQQKTDLRYFYDTFRTSLNDDQKKLLSLFVTDSRSPLIWLKKVFFPKRLRSRLPGEIALRLLFFLGRL